MILDETYKKIMLETDSKNPVTILEIDESDGTEPVKVAEGYRVKLIVKNDIKDSFSL